MSSNILTWIEYYKVYSKNKQKFSILLGFNIKSPDSVFMSALWVQNKFIVVESISNRFISLPEDDFILFLCDGVIKLEERVGNSERLKWFINEN